MRSPGSSLNETPLNSVRAPMVLVRFDAVTMAIDAPVCGAR